MRVLSNRWAKLALVVGVAVASSPLGAGCSSTPVNVPVRTFERAQKVDVVCLQVIDPITGQRVAAKPLRQAECAPVPPGVDGSTLPNHLYALVTQTTRGEVAVVDLTAGWVVDEDRSTPGINFIPVGALPTDVAVAHDGQMAFVSASEPNKPALYGISSARVLGDSQFPVSFSLPPPITLPSLPACSLPQVPIALAIVERNGASTGDAGTDGGAASQTYDVVAVLAGSAAGGAKIVTIDPRPLLRGAGLDTSAGATVQPGSLSPCPVTSVLDLGSALPPSFVAGAPWDDGVKYVDGGVDLRPTEPALPASCAVTVTDGGVEGGAVDGGDAGPVEAGAGDAGAGDAGAGEGGVPSGVHPIDFGPLDPPRPSSAVFDDQAFILYVADDALPLIHAIDMKTPGAPHELAPLLATSLEAPSRKVSVGQIALSPTTSDFKRFLYAVDAKQGSLIIYDVTAGAAASRLPLVRPHPETNPFQPLDRMVFNAPIAAVSFVRHDWPLTQINGTPLTNAKTGLICNPNPNASADANNPTVYKSTDEALGGAYRYNSGLISVGLGAFRLRGVFAFVTLSNGTIATIDVDDWDAPCRRPDPLGPDGTTGTTQPSALAVAEPAATDPNDTNPYHAPSSQQTVGSSVIQATTSLEAFFPVSAPHRVRSGYFLRNDPSAGVHVPNLTGIPALVALNAAKPTTGVDGLANPIMLPTFSTYADPQYIANPTEPDPAKRVSTLPTGSEGEKDVRQLPAKPKFSLPGLANNTTPGVRFAYEDPQVHIDQDWQITYEGVVPGFDGLAATVAPTPGDPQAYESLTLSVPNGLLCRRGVEDQRLGNERVAAELAEMQRLHIPAYVDAGKWTGDYVQIADDILPQGDPYWAEADDPANKCWDDSLDTPDKRQSACQNTYGSLSDPTPTPFRDFPILEAYDDHMVVGRFGYEDPKNPATVNRQIVSRDPSNVPLLKLARCCFHRQVTFKVRTGGRWLAVGSAVGYLHHVTAGAGGACVQSCEPREQLLNARAADVPRPTDPAAQPPDRNSPLSLRNPMFSVVIWSGAAPPAPTMQAPHPGHTTTQRDYVWKFSARGQFSALTISLGATTTAVSPQSMRFIDSLGQLAVVDGASQGLVLISLDSIALAHSPYF